MSKTPEMAAPGTVGHRISLLEAVTFGQSKVKDFPKTELSEFREQLKHACKNYPNHPSSTDIIARMEAMQDRFGERPLQLMHRTVFPSILQSAEDERREREKDLEYESRVDYASWETDGQKDE